MIATQVTEQGRGPVAKHVLVLGTCSHIPGVDVDECETEAELLLKWRDVVADSDPDIVIGYNICNFDLPYLMDRAAALKLDTFPTWSRTRNKCVADTALLRSCCRSIRMSCHACLCTQADAHA